jgi:hypothetical protein
LFGSFEITSIRLYTPLRNPLRGLHSVFNLIEVISSWTKQILRSILKYLAYNVTQEYFPVQKIKNTIFYPFSLKCNQFARNYTIHNLNPQNNHLLTCYNAQCQRGTQSVIYPSNLIMWYMYRLNNSFPCFRNFKTLKHRKLVIDQFRT